ncbi:MAG: PLDc N-terminal domain-containing protein [Rhodobacteraceae bacterium]|nr:PLDc N-terminal domain-containing protein [Paracoccaceae bacterium]
MRVEVAGLGGLILLGLAIYALVNIIGSNAGTGAKVIWTLLVLLLPLIGFIIWLLAGPRARQRGV